MHSSHLISSCTHTHENNIAQQFPRQKVLQKLQLSLEFSVPTGRFCSVSPLPTAYTEGA